MKQRRILCILVAGAALVLRIFSASNAMALERWLVPDTSQCAADLALNPCHTTLQDAVDKASAGDSIRILPSSTAYPANVTLTKNVTIFGQETARTILNGLGNAAIITISGVTTAMKIRNITFFNASPGIALTNASSQITIENNIFEVGSSNTAIQIADTSSATIVNNTFYQNATAILSTPNMLTIVNNIFSVNTLAISANVAIDNIKSNLFFNNGSNGPTGILFNASGNPDYKQNVNSQDPQFVDPAETDVKNRDFHLISTTTTSTASGDASIGGSNSINGVSPPDMGAYGGSDSDTIPFPVSGVTGTAASATSVTLNWNLNKNYMVEGYNVYFNVSQGPPYSNGPVNAGNVNTYTLDVSSQLTGSVAALTAPALTTSPASQQLTVSWPPVPGATGYEVSYKKASDSTFIVLPAVTGSPVTIGGLTDPIDGVPTYYDISVRAFFQASVHAAIKSFYAPSSPPSVNQKEALEFSNDVEVPLGDQTFGPASTTQDFPEPVVAFPNLPNNGCFIATAAYGYYSAPQVQALREFRDRYLMTSSLGRAFVEWYYRYGPIGAAFMETHPWLKPLVRVALLPAVGGALFLTGTSFLVKMMFLACFIVVTTFILRRRILARSGGTR